MSVVLHGRSHTAHNASRIPKSKGPRFSRDRGPPLVNRAFLRSGVSNIKRFQGSREGGFFLGLQGPGVKGIKGSWVPVDPKV